MAGGREELYYVVSSKATMIHVKLLGTQNFAPWVGQDTSFHLLFHLPFFAICFVPSTKLFLCDLSRVHTKYISSCQGKKWVK